MKNTHHTNGGGNARPDASNTPTSVQTGGRTPASPDPTKPRESKKTARSKPSTVAITRDLAMQCAKDFYYSAMESTTNIPPFKNYRKGYLKYLEQNARDNKANRQDNESDIAHAEDFRDFMQCINPRCDLPEPRAYFYRVKKEHVLREAGFEPSEE